MTDPATLHRLVLDVWNAATASHSLDECADRVATLTRAQIPADEFTLWRLARDASEANAITVPLDGARTPTSEHSARRMVSLQGFDVVQPLRAMATPLVVEAPFDSPLAHHFVGSMWKSALILPLDDRERPTGLVVFASHKPRAFSADQRALAQELRAPLSTAVRLENERETEQRTREALEAERRALLQRLDRDEVAGTIVGGDGGLRDVMIRVEQVAPTDAPVLLLGETGAGKEVIARAIHARSRRNQGPIVRVNCGAIAPGLIDSELFGHEKGSFTGATTTRKGWFERADGGTLFLDEVAELPLDAQVRLLRILQDGIFERVGAQRPTRVDVRVVAATHRNLRDMVKRGAFREDLWYRLSVFPIEILPLRDRPEDIPALASHFAARAGTRLGGAPLTLTPNDVELLITYAWPGNVRELATVIERAAILGDGKRLRIGAALGNVSAAVPASADLPRLAVDPAASHDDGTILPLDRAMARHIERALHVTRGRIEGRGGAAALLRINPHTLRARMRKLGVDWANIRENLRNGEEDIGA